MAMYNEKVLDHFQNPRHAGEMENPDGVGSVGNPYCGDVMKLYIKVENNVITDARCVGEMFRGFEVILRGRSPLDAQQITQRICGVCPYAHAIASSYAQEHAYKLRVPSNGRILHNLIQGANHLYDYLLHFYQLSALDFVDVTAVLSYTGKDSDLVKVRDWVKAELARFRASQ